MNLDYTYITVFGFPVFEPVILLTNTILLALGIIFQLRLRRYNNAYSRQMGMFILFLGLSSAFGAVVHAVHYQLGVSFFDTMFFLMNAFSFFSIYFCFTGTLHYTARALQNKKRVTKAVFVYVLLMLLLCFLLRSFLIIKINAALVIVYSLSAHIWAMKKLPESGNRLVTLGLLISCLPVLVHSLRISLHEWFNYKDLAHLFMIIALVVIFAGVKRNAAALGSGASAN